MKRILKIGTGVITMAFLYSCHQVNDSRHTLTISGLPHETPIQLISAQDGKVIDSATIDDKGTAKFFELPNPDVYKPLTFHAERDTFIYNWPEQMSSEFILEDNQSIRIDFNAANKLHEKRTKRIWVGQVYPNKENRLRMAIKKTQIDRSVSNDSLYAFYKATIEKNPNAKYPLHALKMDQSRLSASQLSSVLQHIDPILIETHQGIELQDILVKKSTPSPFRFASSNLDTLDGVERLKAINLLVYWTSWCTYCVRKLPLLDEIWQTYQHHPYISLVNISMDKNTQDWLHILNRHQIKDTHFIAVENTRHSLADRYDVFSYPTYVLTNSFGEKIVYTPNNSQNPELEYIRFLNKYIEDMQY